MQTFFLTTLAGWLKSRNSQGPNDEIQRIRPMIHDQQLSQVPDDSFRIFKLFLATTVAHYPQKVHRCLLQINHKSTTDSGTTTLYIEDLKILTVEEICFVSDGCANQNRNMRS